MTDPTYTYRPGAAQLAERIVELATDGVAVNHAAREVVAAWDAWDDDATYAGDRGATRLEAAIAALREVLA